MTRAISIWSLLILILMAFISVAVAASTATTQSPALYLPIVLAPKGSGSTTVTLEDGGTVTGMDGILMGTISGTITSALKITIAPIVPPSTPLDPNLTPLGEYYDIQADRDQYTVADKPFLLGLPVPNGADTTHLALAVLIPADKILDNSGSDSDWFLFRGIYDPTDKLFLAAINGFSKAGYQVVLVDAPNQTPLAPATTNRPLIQNQSAEFEVLCSTFYSSSSQCGTAQTDKVAQELSNAYDDFQDLLGFRDPHLPDRYFLLHPMRLLGYHSYYNILLVPPSTSDCILEGQYIADSNLEICVPRGSAITAHDIEVIRHEYFHATQYGYSTILNNPVDSWVTDGTATAAQRSVSMMARTLDYDLHPVDVPLTNPSVEHRYSAQDFFVYVGLKNGTGIDYLKSLFDKGAQTQDVVDDLGQNGTHLPVYWDWAKNQAMEKTHDFDGALADPCSIQKNVVEDLLFISFDHQQSLAYPIGSVDPLSTAVVQILWDGSYDIADGMVIPTGGLGDTEALDALRYKFYRDGEGGCEAIPDGRRLFDAKDGEISPNLDYYVLISNIDPAQAHPYTVFFEVAPIPPN